MAPRSLASAGRLSAVRLLGPLLVAPLVMAGAAHAAGDPAKVLVGRTAVMSLEADPEAELDKALVDAGYSAVQPPRDLPADAFPAHRVEVLTTAAAPGTVITFWRLERPIDRFKGEWRVVAAFNTKIGSEAAFSDACPGNAKDKSVAVVVFHEGGEVGGPVKQVLAAFRLDRQAGKVERLTGKPPACKATEPPLGEG